MESQTRTISDALIITIEQAEKDPDSLLRILFAGAEKAAAHGENLEEKGAEAVAEMILRQCVTLKHCGRSYARFLELVIQHIAEFFDEA